jgi:hypothetical protein
MTVRITVDDSSIDLYCESLESVCMVDLNTNDNFYELALYSTGPSMDPSIDFLHYDGVDIIPVTYDLESGLYGDVNADIDDVYPTFGPLWTDKKGRIITSLDNAAFTHTRIAFAYYVLDNHTFKKYDIEGIKLPYDSVISNDFTAYFTPCENEPDYFENYNYINNSDKVREFKKGQSVQIISYGKMYQYYAFYVNIDGEKGVLAYFLGD